MIQRLWNAGQIRAAYEASVKSTEARPTTDHPFRDPVRTLDTARQWHEHGILCWHNARFPEAGAVLGRAHVARKAALGEDHPETLDTLERLAALSHYLVADDAVARFEDVVARFERVHGEDHVRVAIARRNLAACLRDRQRIAEARTILDRAVDVIERALPPEHPDVVAALKVDAMIHNAEGTYHAAIGLAERAVKLGTRIWDEDHPLVASPELTIAGAELRLGEHKRALKRMPAVVKRLQRGYGEHPLVAIAMSKQAHIELELGSNFQHAETLIRAAMAMYRKTYPPMPVFMGWILFQILFESRQIVEAGELVLELGDRPSQRQRAAMAGKLANYLVKLGDYPRAIPWLERTRDLVEDPEVRVKWDEQVDRWTRHVKRFERDRDT